MNRLKKGPEIKLSELRMPQFVVDLYYDLHDRHLLPVVALLVVGIVAVPLLLGGSSESDPTPTPSLAGEPAQTSSLVVAKETANLRDYRRRLDHLTAKDPFVQQYVEEEGGEGAGAAEPEADGESAPAIEEEAGSESGGTTITETESKPKIVYFTYAIDVRVTPVSVDGKPSKAEPSVRRNLPPLTMLPSRSTPALTYMGPSKDGEKALMLVSSDVTSIFGDSSCVVGSETCQLLALEAGKPETVVFGGNSRSYRIELLKVELQTADHLERAPLGDGSGSHPHPRGESPQGR